MQHTIVIPRLRDIARHALPNVVEGRLVPLVLFIAFLEIAGTLWALLIALAWTLACLGYRLASGRRVPGLIVVSAVALSARTIAALVTGSMVVYFIQPTISTVLTGTAFLVSTLTGRPLAARLADDIVPLDAATKAHPLVRGFFLRLSLLWSLTSLINALITVWLLFTQSITTFMVVKSAMGPGFGIVMITAALLWFRHAAERQQVRVEWAAAGGRCGLVPAPAPA
jgi:intracellular septation protein A